MIGEHNIRRGGWQAHYVWSSNGSEIKARCLNEDAISGHQIQENKIIF